MKADRVLILSATAFEQADLAAALEDGVEYRVGGRPCRAGGLYGRRATLVEGGMGAVNTAHALTCHLAASAPDWVLQVGIGGAYPAAGLGAGDWVLADCEVYGDVGVRTPDGWRGADEIGIPLLEAGGTACFNAWPMQPAWVAASAACLRAAGPVAVGPFVTVQECSGTDALGLERQGLPAAVGAGGDAVCENMEGAAAAHICRLYGVPLVEVRAVSNRVEDRRREAWDIPLACRRAQAAAAVLLREIHKHASANG